MSVFTNPASAASEHATAYVAAVLDLVGNENPLDVLRRMPTALERMLDALTPEQIGRPEAPGKWSVREVMQHLADAELVWGYRVRMILAHDRPQLTSYDQDLWADQLRYRDADAHEAVTLFGLLRRANLRLLEQASSADLRRVGLHVERGEESIESLIRLNAGHDILHLRQLDRICGALT